MYKRIFSGVVIKHLSDKTVVVLLSKRLLVSKYLKIVKKNFRFVVHDENNFFSINDKVKIISSRPISKMKKWIVIL